MGCGRSTLGSDSPKKNKKKDSAGDCDSDGDSGSSTTSTSSARKQQMINKLAPFGSGGALLAQAKISDSQQDFFMMLDEKIENGPDYDSESDELERRYRMQEYAQQWHGISAGQVLSPSEGSSLRYTGEDTCGSGDITEDDEEDEGLSEPERIPDEAVREQYMFMGNLYTLTHIRTDDDTTEPKVDVVVNAKNHQEENQQLQDGELGHKLNGSVLPEEAEVVEDHGHGHHTEVTDGKSTKPSSRPSSRPASLILRSVFPADPVQE